MHKSILYIFLIPLLFLASCDSGEESVPVSSEVSFSIRVPKAETGGNASEIATPAGDNELINTWWMAFADQSGIVRLILERDAAKTNPVEMEEFSATLDRGTYTVYSFANIRPENLGLEFRLGEKVPAGVDASPEWVSATAPHAWSAGKLVPMSGRQTVTVTQQVTQPFAVEVVRMVAKMEFFFSNATDSDMRINQMWLRPMGKGAVDLFPSYHLLGSAPALRSDADTVTIRRGFDKVLPAGGERAVSDIFYVLESQADRADGKGHPTGHYVVLLDVTRRDGVGGKSVRDTISMLTPDLTYINRNDYIRIPVRLADHVVKMDVKFYPPIGGYPAVVNEEKGSDYFISFGTQGVFVITPLMREGVAGAPWMQPSDMDIRVVKVEDPAGILERTVSYDTRTGEITGELNSRTGKAIVTLSVAVKGSQLSYQRKIYIIRED